MIDLLPLVVHSPSSPTEWAHPSKSSCYPSEVLLSAVSGRHITAVSSSPTSVSLSGGRFVLLQTKTKTCSMLYAQYLCCTSCVYYVDARVPNTVIGPFGEQRIISRMLKRLICLWPWCWSCMMLLALHPRRCVLLLAHADGRAAEVGSVLCQWRCVCVCVRKKRVWNESNRRIPFVPTASSLCLCVGPKCSTCCRSTEVLAVVVGGDQFTLSKLCSEILV